MQLCVCGEGTCTRGSCCAVTFGQPSSVRSLPFAIFMSTGSLTTARFSPTCTPTHIASETRPDASSLLTYSPRLRDILTLFNAAAVFSFSLNWGCIGLEDFGPVSGRSGIRPVQGHLVEFGSCHISSRICQTPLQCVQLFRAKTNEVTLELSTFSCCRNFSFSRLLFVS